MEGTKEKRKLLVLLFFIFISLVVSFFVWYFWNQKKNPDQEEEKPNGTYLNYRELYANYLFSIFFPMEQEVLLEFQVAEDKTVYKLQYENGVYEQKKIADSLLDPVSFYDQVKKEGEASNYPIHRKGINLYDAKEKTYYFLSLDSELGLKLNQMIQDEEFQAVLDGKKVESEKKKLYFYKTEEGNYLYSETRLENETDHLIQSYECQKLDCRFYYSSFDSQNQPIPLKRLVIRDNGYFIYDIEENRKVELLLDATSDIRTVEFLSDGDHLKGLLLGRKSSTSALTENALYSMTQKKLVVDFGSDATLSDPVLTKRGLVYRTKQKVATPENYGELVTVTYELISIDTGELITSFQDPGHLIQAVGKLKLLEAADETYYVTMEQFTSRHLFHTYNKNFELLFDGKTYLSQGISSTGELLVANTSYLDLDSTYLVYQADGKLIRESRVYDSIQSIIEDCILVVDGGMLKLVSSTDQVLAELEPWDESKVFLDLFQGSNGDSIWFDVDDNKEGTVHKYQFNRITKQMTMTKEKQEL